MTRNRAPHVGDVHVLAFALSHPWALMPPMLHLLAGILSAHALGHASDPATVAEAVAARKPDPQPRRGSVAVVPVHGVIAPRANFITEASGGTSFDRIGALVRAAADDPAVSTIVLDIDSPGGSVAGAAELAATLRTVRARKPIIAQANHTAASAAFWIAAQATKIHAGPSAMVGSLGVYTMHTDMTEALAKNGLKRTFVAEGKYKLEAHDGLPLTEEGSAYLAEIVGKHYARMVEDVALGRGVKAAAVRSGYGEGRLLTAEDALGLGMIDKLSTMDETLARLLPPGGLDLADPARGLAPTSQEPAAPATDQEAQATAHWRARIERDLLAEAISSM